MNNMPVRKCSNGKYRIGKGKCMYTSKASAERAYRGYLGATYAEDIEFRSSIARSIASQPRSGSQRKKPSAA